MGNYTTILRHGIITMPSSRGSPKPGTEPGSPAFQVESLPLSCRYILHCIYIYTYIIYKYSPIIYIYYLLCLFFMYYLCEKYYKPIMVQCYIAYCVSLGTLANFVGPMNKLDLWMHSQKGICSYAGDLLYSIV